MPACWLVLRRFSSWQRWSLSCVCPSKSFVWGLLCGVTLGYSLTPDCWDTFLFRGAALTLRKPFSSDLEHLQLLHRERVTGSGAGNTERVETHHSPPHLHSTGTALEEEKPGWERNCVLRLETLPLDWGGVYKKVGVDEIHKAQGVNETCTAHEAFPAQDIHKAPLPGYKGSHHCWGEKALQCAQAVGSSRGAAFISCDLSWVMLFFLTWLTV